MKKKTRVVKTIKRKKGKSVKSKQAVVTKVEAPEKQIILTQVAIPIDKKKYLKDQKEFAESVDELCGKFDKLLDQFVKKTRFKVECHDKLKGVIRHYMNVYMCYEIPDDEFKSVFINKDQTEYDVKPRPDNPIDSV